MVRWTHNNTTLLYYTHSDRDTLPGAMLHHAKMIILPLCCCCLPLLPSGWRNLLQDLSPQRFIEAFEDPRQPVVITGLTDGWPAVQQWTPEALLQQYADHKFKVRWGVGKRPCLPRCYARSISSMSSLLNLKHARGKCCVLFMLHCNVVCACWQPLVCCLTTDPTDVIASIAFAENGNFHISVRSFTL